MKCVVGSLENVEYIMHYSANALTAGWLFSSWEVKRYSEFCLTSSFFHMSSYIGKITWYKIFRPATLWTYHNSHSRCWGSLSLGLKPSFWPWAWDEQMEGFLHLAYPRVNQVQEMMIHWQSVQNRQEGWPPFCQLDVGRAFCFVLQMRNNPQVLSLKACSRMSHWKALWGRCAAGTLRTHFSPLPPSPLSTTWQR